MAHVEIFADGACSGNPGPGGWGAVLISAGRQKEIAGGAPTTTNNRMELTAAIEALTALTKASAVDFYTDSTYVRSGITGWIDGWKRNGWKTSDRKPVKNIDLWQALDAARGRHEITWHWVKGHADNAGNNRADELARQGMAPFKPRPARKAGPAEG